MKPQKDWQLQVDRHEHCTKQESALSGISSYELSFTVNGQTHLKAPYFSITLNPLAIIFITPPVELSLIE